MSLTLIDKDRYVLDGVIYEIPLLDRIPLNELSVERAVAHYKNRVVVPGHAFGKLDLPIQESIDNDMSMEEYAPYSMQDPIAIAQHLSIDGTFDDEEVLSPQESAFQLTDIIYDKEGRNILGRIELMNTPSGNVAMDKIDAGMKCVMSQASVDEVVDNKERGRGFVLNQIIRKIRGGWRISFEQEETANEQDNQK